jgi:hypothetical protein
VLHGRLLVVVHPRHETLPPGQRTSSCLVDGLASSVASARRGRQEPSSIALRTRTASGTSTNSSASSIPRFRSSERGGTRTRSRLCRGCARWSFFSFVAFTSVVGTVARQDHAFVDVGAWAGEKRSAGLNGTARRVEDPAVGNNGAIGRFIMGPDTVPIRGLPPCGRGARQGVG